MAIVTIVILDYHLSHSLGIKIGESRATDRRMYEFSVPRVQGDIITD